MIRSRSLRGSGAVAAALLTLAFSGILIFMAPPAGAFEGSCTPDSTNPEDGTCTLDEPEGSDPATYGTVTYDRDVTGSEDSLTFDFPDGLDFDEVQVCLTLVADSPSNPYEPTNANTCSGSSEDRALANSDAPFDPAVVDVDAFFAGSAAYSPGADLWFTVHVTASVGNEGANRTMYVTGGSAFPSSPPSSPTFALTVTKDVVSDSGSETFSFAVDCGAYELSSSNSSDSAIAYTGGDATFDLGDDGSITLSEIPEDTECTVAETAPATGGGTWSTTINGTEDEDRSATVVLDDDRTLDFVNTFNEVLVTTVDTTTTATAANASGQEPEQESKVLGVEIQRGELPRTGLTPVLVTLGSGLTAAGAALVALGRRRETRTS